MSVYLPPAPKYRVWGGVQQIRSGTNWYTLLTDLQLSVRILVVL